MDESRGLTRYLNRRNVIPVGRRLSLFPPKVRKEGRYILISSLKYQYISTGASHLLIGSGTSLSTLIRFAKKRGIYPEIAPFPNMYRSVGGLYSDGLIISLTEDSVRPCHVKSIAMGGGRPFYLDFLVRFSGYPIYLAYDVKTESLDGLRALLRLSMDYMAGGGVQIIYMSDDGYRFRLVIHKRYRKHILDSLSSIDVNYEEVDYLGSYSRLFPLDKVWTEWGRFYLLLFRDVEPGTLLTDSEKSFIYFGDSNKKVYIVISKNLIKEPVPERSIYFNEGRVSVIK